MTGAERIPRARDADTLSRMRDWSAYRAAGLDDIWHVLAASATQTLWCGVPILKNHFDMARYFHLIAEMQPEAVVETGLQEGGSVLFYLDCLSTAGVPETAPYIGVDLDCSMLHAAVQAVWNGSHSEVRRPVAIIKRDCVAYETLDTVRTLLEGRRRLLVVLDSVHTRVHVAEELRLYAPLCGPESRLVVEDTASGGHPVLANYGPCAWDAVQDFMQGLGRELGFEFDRDTERRFGPFTNSPDGWLVRRE